MRRRWCQWVVIGLVGISLGFQWTLLQSVAWTVMLLDRSAEMGWVQAMETTFDGHHPCALCKVVRKGRDTQQQQQTVVLSLAKTDMVAGDEVLAVAAPPTVCVGHIVAHDEYAAFKAFPPPWLPPREA